MNSKTTISTTDARKKLFDIVEEVSSPAVVYTLTERGRPKAVIMSAEEYESLIETFEVMRDFPNILEVRKEADRAMKSGAWKKWPTLDQIKEKEMILRDKPKSNVHTGSHRTGKKRSR